MPGQRAYRALQRVMILDVSCLFLIEAHQVRRPPADDRFTFRMLAADEVYTAARQPENRLDPLFADRILYGRDLCFGAFMDDRLACYAWYALGSIEAEHNCGVHPRSGLAISFPADMAFMYNGFTHSDFRGQRIQPASFCRAVDELAQRGIRRILTTTEWSNCSARRAAEYVGFREIANYARFGLGSAIATLTPARARRLGIRFGSEAVVAPRTNRRVAHRGAWSQTQPLSESPCPVGAAAEC